MRKVSTEAASQIRNLSQQKLTIGLDLGDRSSCYCVLDETGRLPPPHFEDSSARGSLLAAI